MSHPRYSLQPGVLAFFAGGVALLTAAVMLALPPTPPWSGWLVAQMETSSMSAPDMTMSTSMPPEGDASSSTMMMVTTSEASMPPSSLTTQSAGTMETGTFSDPFVDYQQWQYEEFLNAQQNHSADSILPSNEIPQPWEVPAQYYEEVSSLWSTEVAPENPAAAETVQYGCFGTDGQWSTVPSACAPNQLPYLQALHALPALQRAELESAIPVELMNLIDSIIPPPETKTPQQEASVLAIMRAAYIDVGEGGEREIEYAKLRDALSNAELHLTALRDVAAVSASRQSIVGTLAWIAATKFALFTEELTLDQVHDAAQELRTRLENIERAVARRIPQPTAAPAIHNRIAILMQMMDIDVPQILGREDLALDPFAGILMLQIRQLVQEAQTSACWTSEHLCPQTEEILTTLEILLTAVDVLTADHPRARAALTQRHQVLMQGF